MSLFISSLNSGSNGNCYYIGDAESAILVDAGISCRETEKRMKRLGLPMSRVKAIFISHEHGDHISGVEVLAKKYNLPVYVTYKTASYPVLQRIKHFAIDFSALETIQIGNLCIKAFAKFHDAYDPHSFIISCKGVTVGVFTDLGRVCDQLIVHFKQCDAAFLEANYDTSMLENGSYPIYLKNRIRGGEGHLSNEEAYQLFLQHRPEKLKYLLLSHLSKNNNKPELVYNLFSKRAGNTQIIIASRFKETEVFHITNDDIHNFVHPIRTKKVSPPQLQLSLF